MKNESETNAIIEPVSKGLKMKQFNSNMKHFNTKGTTANRTTVRTGFTRLVQLNQVSGRDGGKLLPSLTVKPDSDGAFNIVPDLGFSDPERFYGIHSDGNFPSLFTLKEKLQRNIADKPCMESQPKIWRLR